MCISQSGCKEENGRGTCVSNRIYTRTQKKKYYVKLLGLPPAGVCPPRLKCVIIGKKKKKRKEKEKYLYFFFVFFFFFFFYCYLPGDCGHDCYQLAPNETEERLPLLLSSLLMIAPSSSFCFSCLGVMFLLHHEIFLIVIASYIF